MLTDVQTPFLGTPLSSPKPAFDLLVFRKRPQHAAFAGVSEQMCLQPSSGHMSYPLCIHILCICRRREIIVGVNMVGVSMAVHDAICECFVGAMLEPCLLKPCFHVAGYATGAGVGFGTIEVRRGGKTDVLRCCSVIVIINMIKL